MKKLLLSLTFLFILSVYKAQWMPQTAPTTTNNLYSVFAIDANAVGATGFTGPIRTINGGTTWSQNITLGGVNTYEIHSANPAKWYILTQNSTWFMKMGNPSGVTLNSGKPDSVLSLHFYNPACAIAVGTAGKIEATCDTGATWQYRSSGITQNLNAIWFADKDTGCAVGAGGKIVRTTDAGTTWTTVVSGTAFPLNAIHFPTANVGYVVGSAGLCFKSVDAGKTWTSVPTGTTTALNGVFFIDQDTGYVVGNSGLIMKTGNGGANWTTMTSGVTQNLNSVHFATPVDGWVVGNAGTVLKYLGGSVGIRKQEALQHVNVFPNPAKDKITLTSSVPNGELKLMNALGEVIYQKTFINEAVVDISKFSSGIYFIEFTSDYGTSVKKFVKE